MPATALPTVIDIRRVCMAFAKPSGEPLAVLTDIDITLAEGEILGLLGRSGSGKSTLLRIAGGSSSRPLARYCTEESRSADRPRGLPSFSRPLHFILGSPSSRMSNSDSMRCSCRSTRQLTVPCQRSI